MIYRHVVGKSVVVHEDTNGIERMYVEKMREGRVEELESWLRENDGLLNRPRACMVCMERFIPSEYDRESIELAWVFGNKMDDMCMPCYKAIVLGAFRMLEKEQEAPKGVIQVTN